MSDKPLADRLQVKKGRRLAIVGAPADLDATIGAFDQRADPAAAEVVRLFAPDRARLDVARPAVLATARGDAILWIAYPKLTSKRAADLSRDILHDLAPAHGLDAVSQIAIDGDWSALRFKRVG